MQAEVVAATLAAASAETDPASVAVLADMAKADFEAGTSKDVQVNPLAVTILSAVATLRGAESNPLVTKFATESSRGFRRRLLRCDLGEHQGP